jgi:diadenosine tetraphosphate (Ap4A) HIT family hydrolase
MTCELCNVYKDTYRLVYENEHSLAVVIFNPLTPPHLMVIPRRHAKDPADLTKDESQSLHQLLSQTRKRLHQLYPEFPPTCLFQMGKNSSQPHLHYHVICTDAGVRDMWINSHKKANNLLGAEKLPVSDNQVYPPHTIENLTKIAKLIRSEETKNTRKELQKLTSSITPYL